MDFESVQKDLKINSDSLLWAVENLGKSGMLSIERESSRMARLTEEGKRYLDEFPEEKLVRDIEKKGNEPQIGSISNKIGLIWAKRNSWIKIDEGKVILTEDGIKAAREDAHYAYRDLLDRLEKAEGTDVTEILEKNTRHINDLKNRDLIQLIERGAIKKLHILEKAENHYGEKGIGVLTRDLITSGRWKASRIRPYDINASTERIYPARIHPMHEFLDIIRNIWLNMGFMEVSGPIIESAFWNFDALFSPQDHPTRDMQDTFFLKNPEELDIEDLALMGRIKKMHVRSWKEKWREDVAKQALLRTHTTSVSARYINRFANDVAASYPIKMFSIGKVFRNETIDYKHLAELHQVDGIIIGNNLTLSNLIYTLKQFYSQLGMENITIKPSYFPFVEPGLEVEYYDESKNDTIELCGGGIIRKEITKAMGTSKTVLAWGAGLERLMFEVLGVKSMTDLYKNDIGWLRDRGELKI